MEERFWDPAEVLQLSRRLPCLGTSHDGRQCTFSNGHKRSRILHYLDELSRIPPNRVSRAALDKLVWLSACDGEHTTNPTLVCEWGEMIGEGRWWEYEGDVIDHLASFLQAKWDQARHELSHSRSENVSLVSTINQLKHQEIKLRLRLDDLTSSLETARSRQEEMRREMKGKIISIKIDNELQKGQLASAKAELEARASKQRALEERLKQLTKREGLLQEQIDKLEPSLATSLNKGKDMELRISSLEAEVALKQDHITSMELELATTASRQQKLEAEVHNMRFQEALMQDQTSLLIITLAEKALQQRVLHTNLEKVTASLKTEKLQNVALTGEIDNLTHALEKAMSSRWVDRLWTWVGSVKCWFKMKFSVVTFIQELLQSRQG